ncbi:hypothetical protein JG688_00013205, partial [Phytophthora aleatoria]
CQRIGSDGVACCQQPLVRNRVGFRAENRGITVFDPLQHQNSKNYGMCDTLLKDLFGEMCDLMRIKKETKARQPDVASCGVMVLTFFECFIQGMAIPSKPSPTLLRFLRL